MENISPAILKDCLNKDRKAQFKLYKSCYSVLMGVCMRYHKNENDALEILNTGFLKILNNLDKYRSEVPFIAWIKRIMINTVIDDFRKNKKQKKLTEYTDFQDYDDNVQLVDFNTADQQFDANALEDLIHQLPPMTAKVFNLYAIDGYAHKEIAELLGISDGTSKWHVSAARKKLQEMMKEVINSSKII